MVISSLLSERAINHLIVSGRCQACLLPTRVKPTEAWEGEVDRQTDRGREGEKTLLCLLYWQQSHRVGDWRLRQTRHSRFKHKKSFPSTNMVVLIGVSCCNYVIWLKKNLFSCKSYFFSPSVVLSFPSSPSHHSSLKSQVEAAAAAKASPRAKDRAL